MPNELKYHQKAFLHNCQSKIELDDGSFFALYLNITKNEVIEHVFFEANSNKEIADRFCAEIHRQRIRDLYEMDFSGFDLIYTISLANCYEQFKDFIYHEIGQESLICPCHLRTVKDVEEACMSFQGQTFQEFVQQTSLGIGCADCIFDVVSVFKKNHPSLEIKQNFEEEKTEIIVRAIEEYSPVDLCLIIENQLTRLGNHSIELVDHEKGVFYFSYNKNKDIDAKIKIEDFLNKTFGNKVSSKFINI